MGFAKIKGKLTSRIGCRVRFGAPKDVEAKGGRTGFGEIVGEVWADPKINVSPPRKHETEHDWGDYSFCAQLIIGMIFGSLVSVGMLAPDANYIKGQIELFS